MCKILLVAVVVAVACLAALAAAAPGAVIYAAAPVAAEYATASGYEYQHTVQTPDYFTHASVSAPLHGVASIAPPVVRAAFSEPLAYATYGHLW